MASLPTDVSISSTSKESCPVPVHEDRKPLSCKVSPEGQRGTRRHGCLGEAHDWCLFNRVLGMLVYAVQVRGLDFSKNENRLQV